MESSISTHYDSRRSTDQILKTDILGRVSRSAEKRVQILDEFERSGLKGVPFAKLIGVHYQTFASWIQARRRARGIMRGRFVLRNPKLQVSLQRGGLRRWPIIAFQRLPRMQSLWPWLFVCRAGVYGGERRGSSGFGGAESQPVAPAPQQPVALPSVPRAQRPPRNAPRLPENLPVVEEIIDPETVKQSPIDWRQIGQEVSEQLDYELPRYTRRCLIRRTYVHRTNTDLAPLTAPLPPRLQDRCFAAPGLLAHTIVSKYCAPLPLYRQEQILQTRHHINLPRQTLVNWIDLTADTLDKIIPAHYKGILQTDGYTAYPAFADRRNGDIKLAACWAHARRKF